MRSWKLVLICILLAYLILASAISLAVQYWASVQAPIDRRESAYVEKILVRNVNFHGLDENGLDMELPFACMQLQVIDEVESLGDAPDCG
jgi:hypothetical protein